jgi:hypothetical protein
VTRTLVTAADFRRLAQCCRRFALLRPGRISVEVPTLDAAARGALDERINRLWQACGCGEAAVALWVALALWFTDAGPFGAWRDQAGTTTAVIACAGFVAGVVGLVKLGAIAMAHRRLAWLLDREAAAMGMGHSAGAAADRAPV